MANIYGRQVVVLLTNKSGGSIIAGDVVVIDTTNNTSFTTSTAGAFTGAVGVAQESIANNATGRVLTQGYAALVNVNASVTRGNYGKTYTVAKQATDAGSSRTQGTFCQFLTGGTTPTALVYPVDLGGASLSDPTTTRGDLIARGAAALGRLGIGTAGQYLGTDGTDPIWRGFIGCAAYMSTAQTVSAGVEFSATFDSESFDTNTFHFTSAANLTGTVSKTASSVSIVGSSTSFTTELTVNQVISIPGTAAEIGVVRTITDNTHLDLWQTMANTASGQTATRKNEYMAIPAGYAGYYRVRAKIYLPSTPGSSYAFIRKNATGINGSEDDNSATSQSLKPEAYINCSAGDYLDIRAFRSSGTTTGAATAPGSNLFEIEYVGP